jgi:flagellar protein FliO/FliZ
MKPAVLAAAAACCIVGAAAALAAEPAAAPAAEIAAVPAIAAAAAPAEPTAASTPAQPGIAAPALRAPMAPTPSASALPASASAGSLLQTILALSFVLALLASLAWAMKRYGPRYGGSNATLRLVGSLSLGGRERIIVIEVADQWIVVGAAPGRVNALATMPRQPSSPNAASGATITEGASSATFADWLKQTIDKRHGK